MKVGVDAVEPPHATHQIGPARLDQQMVMVRDQTVGVAPPPLLRDLLDQQIEKLPAAMVSEEDGFLPFAQRSHMI